MTPDGLLITTAAILSLSLGILGVYFLISARRSSELAIVLDRLGGITAANDESQPRDRRLRPSGPWVTLLRRVGLAPSARLHLGILLVVVTACTFGYLVLGVPGLLAALLIATLLMGIAAVIAFRRRRRQLQDELPIFLDRMIRSIKTGSSVVNAFSDCIADTGGRLGPVLRQAKHYVDLGYSLGDALVELARVHHMKEFQIMALAARVTSRYGGSPVGLFRNLIELIRHRDKIRRQLYAMTSETRVSAWVLALMPLVIAGYIVSTNPDYILTLWQHDSGQWVMIGAVGWQVIGVLWLWRLVRSLG